MKNNKTIYKLLCITVLIVFYSNQLISQPLNEEKALFEQKCAACHTIGKGRLVGPDLAGVNKRRSKKWLNNFREFFQINIIFGVLISGSCYIDTDKYCLQFHLAVVSKTGIN